MDLIDREALVKEIELLEIEWVYVDGIFTVIDEQSTVEAVQKGAYEQVKWERDIAISQLNDYGVQFGEQADCARVVRCKDCDYYKLTNKEKGYGKCMLIGDDDVWNDTDYCSYGIKK